MRVMLLSALLLVGAVAPARAASDVPAVSWGKPGVSYEAYRVDAITCAAQGHFKDISGTRPAKEFLNASKRYDNRLTTGTQNGVETAVDLAHIVRGLRPEKRMEEVGEILQTTVDGCLLDRGYVRYRLTAEQQRSLSQLKKGSPERHAYLHRLGSNPAILASQAEPVVASR